MVSWVGGSILHGGHIALLILQLVTIVYSTDIAANFNRLDIRGSDITQYNFIIVKFA